MKHLFHVAMVTVLLSGCSPKTGIVGSWYNVRSKSHTVRYDSNGTWTSFDPVSRTTVTGKYSWVNDTTLAIEVQSGSGPIREELQVQLKNDTMAVTKSNGVINLWKRAEQASP